MTHDTPQELIQIFKNWDVTPAILTVLINETSMVIKIESKKGITMLAYLAGNFGMPKMMVDEVCDEFTKYPYILVLIDNGF